MCWKSLFSIASLPVITAAGFGEISIPIVNDPRLELTVFAAEPEIVTPVGIAIDSRNRIFVVESHTHMPPKDYPGPKSDHIKVFEDTNGDGKPDRITTFAEGFNDAMNLAFCPEGNLYVVCAREVYRLDDKDGDGRSESRTRVLELVTRERYAHNSLLGITFSHDGWMYISRGNTGGHSYSIRGADGSSVSGYGDGGNIIRCRPDGSEVQLVATGFWNAFDLKFDFQGRLLSVDNDPDSRGPNRFLHIVPHGDYGYKSLYGGSGLHPYQAWEGELPGTLPMIAGVGEAPSGLLDCTRAALPPEYRGSYLSTIWGEHTIVRTHTAPSGASLRGTNSILIQGTQAFRPVAIDADRNGVIYITDWVERDYPNHGKGRIWRLAPKAGVNVMNPRGPLSAPEQNPAAEEFDQLLSQKGVEQYAALRDKLADPDPFLRHAATMALAQPDFKPNLLRDLDHADARVRLGALLALRRAGIEEPAPIVKKLLSDPDLEIRRMALIWAGESFLSELEPDLSKAVTTPGVSPALFETYLATLQNLSPAVTEATRKQVRGNEISRRLDPKLIESIAFDAGMPAMLRSLAVARLAPAEIHANFQKLVELATGEEAALRLESVRTLAHSTRPETADVLLRFARDPKREAELRAEAISVLAIQSPKKIRELLPLLEDSVASVQLEAARALRLVSDDPNVQEVLQKTLAASRGKPGRESLIEQLAFTLGAQARDISPGLSRPASPEEWTIAAAQGGDAAAGRRVFFSNTSSCSQCHRVQARGGIIGPDLSTAGRAMTRAQLVHAILRPSDDVAPEFQGWTIETTDGESHSGLQLHHKSGGAIDLITMDGRTVRFPGNRIESYGAMTLSLMPEGLEHGLSVHEFRDLIAFLEALK
jgi:putative membrane-bound dehydrogenase-like protein